MRGNVLGSKSSALAALLISLQALAVTRLRSMQAFLFCAASHAAKFGSTTKLEAEWHQSI